FRRSISHSAVKLDKIGQMAPVMMHEAYRQQPCVCDYQDIQIGTAPYQTFCRACRNAEFSQGSRKTAYCPAPAFGLYPETRSRTGAHSVSSQSQRRVAYRSRRPYSAAVDPSAAGSRAGGTNSA